ERAFQPGKLEGETRAQTKARHVAEHAADNAAKRAEKKKVEPKNKTKAPTSAKPPAPPKETPASSSNFLERRGQSLANAQNEMFAPMTSSDRRAAKKLSNKTAYAAKKVARRGMKARFGASTPDNRIMSESDSRSPAWGRELPPNAEAARNTIRATPSILYKPEEPGNYAQSRARVRAFVDNELAASAARKPAAEKRAAKKAYNKYKHNASRTFTASQRKRFGGGPGGTPATPSKPAGPKAPSGGFVSTFKPQVRTFDPMVGQKQYGLNSKPYNDSPEAHRTLVKNGMAGRTGNDQRPTHVYDDKGKMVHDVGPYSDVGRANATSPMFPGGTHDAPAPLQPHMTGKDSRIVEKGGNFRIWQGPKRSETVVQHRTGRQINLPFDPAKNKTPAGHKAILDYANANEKPFLQKTGWANGLPITQKGGRLGQIGRFSIGAAKAGGILSLPIAAIS
ncbi:MAG: hypothetical protein EBY81_06935, partial [Verrucomicrobia bacterium]|nr:hypothetical protein [Verrucomicrobiota bacterium]